MACLSYLAAAAPAQATQGIPYLINFQGRLTDNNGNILADGYYNMKLRIFDAASAGTNLWEEDRVVVAGPTDYRVHVVNGLFSVQLGSVTALSPSIFNSSSTRYLEIELPSTGTNTCSSVGCASWTEGAFSPRHTLAASPYSFVADTLDGLDSTAFAQVGTTNSFTDTNTFSKSGGAGIVLSGSAASSGSLLQIGSTLSSGNASGTLIGANGTFTGDLLNLQVSNSTKLKVDNSGNLTLASGAGITIGATAGASTTCSGGNVLQNQVVTGGIVTGGTCVAPGSGANTTLSNLGVTAINASLTPDTNNNYDLGSTGAVWKDVFAALIDAGTTTSTLGIGTSHATAISIGQSGVTTAISGNVTLGAVSASTAASTIDIADTTNGTGTQTVTIGSSAKAANSTTIEGSTVSVGNSTAAHTINIGNGGTAAQAINLGSTSSTSTTTLNGGVNGTTPTLALQAASGGYIAIGTANANTLQIGTVGSTAAATTVNLATSTGAAETVNIGGTTGAGNSNASTVVNIQGGATQESVANAGVTIKTNTVSATAFSVQNNSGNNVFGVDTSAGVALFGKSATLAGSLVIYGGTSGSITLNTVASVNGGSNATITLPSAGTNTSGQCLQSASGSTTSATTLQWGSCGGGGGGGTRTITLSPEYPGGVLHDPGTNDTGNMTSEWDATNNHSYYDWYSSQSTLQSYYVFAHDQLPSDYVKGSFGTLKIWVNPVTGTYNASNYDVKVLVTAPDGTACETSATSILPGATGWSQQSVSLSNCTINSTTDDFYTAGGNGLYTISLQLFSKSSFHVQIGEISYQYTSND